MRSEVETEIIAVLVFADVQENLDGTWTAIARLGEKEVGPLTAESRAAALNRVADAASVSADFMKRK